MIQIQVLKPLLNAYCFSTLTDIDFMQQFDKHHIDCAFVRSMHEVECRNKLPRFKYFQKKS